MVETTEGCHTRTQGQGRRTGEKQFKHIGQKDDARNPGSDSFHDWCGASDLGLGPGRGQTFDVNCWGVLERRILAPKRRRTCLGAQEDQQRYRGQWPGTRHGKADRGEPLDDQKQILFKDWAEDWLARSKSRVKGFGIMSGHFENHLLPTFGNKSLGDIFVADINRWQSKQLKTLEPGTVKRQLNTLKACLNDAIKSERLEKSVSLSTSFLKRLSFFLGLLLFLSHPFEYNWKEYNWNTFISKEGSLTFMINPLEEIKKTTIQEQI